MSVAVITTAAGRHEHFRQQRRGIRRGRQRPDIHVVVAMDDPVLARIAADDGGRVVELPVQGSRLPLAAARNAGAEHALELGAQLLIFLDVDCIPGPAMIQRYAEYSRQAPDALLSGTVSYLPPAGGTGYDLTRLAELAEPHPARPAPADDTAHTAGDLRLFWSLSFAVTARTWSRIGGFCERYQGYGAEDTDFGQQAERAGVDLHWVGGAPAFHQYHPTTSPPVQHVDDILRNARVFHERWGWWPMIGWLEEFDRLGLVRYDPRADTWSARGLELDGRSDG